jgi:hypothetical protein
MGLAMVATVSSSFSRWGEFSPTGNGLSHVPSTARTFRNPHFRDMSKLVALLALLLSACRKLMQ